MPIYLRIIPILLTLIILVACTPSFSAPNHSTATLPTPSTPTLDFSHLSDGGGEPRSGSYWLLWNTCAADNKSDAAAANGGREAGWIILDDLIQEPGILLGDLPVESCPQSLAILNQTDLQGEDKSNDALYQLASQVLVAELNLAVGAETCPAVREALLAGHSFLASYQFDGQGDYLGLGNPLKERDTVIFTVQQLGEYNAGSLCK